MGEQETRARSEVGMLLPELKKEKVVPVREEPGDARVECHPVEPLVMKL
jgi:hypothetical protein